MRGAEMRSFKSGAGENFAIAVGMLELGKKMFTAETDEAIEAVRAGVKKSSGQTG
jgi:hypothetical protein